MNIRRRLKSFKYAANGIKIIFQEEPNARIHLIATLLVILSGFIFQLSFFEWIIVVFCIGLVFSMELINTALERMANYISPEYHETIKRVKDLSAAAVLVSAVVAIITAILIFVPKIG